MHESLDEFKFWPDTATSSRVICPCVSVKLMYSVVNTLASTCMKAWTSLNFGQIPPPTPELSALACLKNLLNTLAPTFLAHLSRRLKGELIVYRSIRRPCVRPSVRACVRASVNIFKLEYLRNQWANRNQILSEALLGWGIYCIRFWTR